MRMIIATLLLVLGTMSINAQDQINLCLDDSILIPKIVTSETEIKFTCACKEQLEHVPISNKNQSHQKYLFQYTLFSDLDCVFLHEHLHEWKRHLLNKCGLFSNQDDWNDFHELQEILKSTDYFKMAIFYNEKILIYGSEQDNYILISEQ